MVRSSRLAHDGSTLLSSSTDPGASRAPLATIMLPYRTGVQRPRDAQRPRERRASLGTVKAIRGGMQPRTPSGKPPSRIRRRAAPSPTATTRSRPSADERVRHPTQVRTGAGRVGEPPTESWAGAECSAAPARSLPGRMLALSRPTPTRVPPDVERGSASLRMSMRQPVSRAASRAFWPSLPMASDSWKSGTTTRAVRVARVEHGDRHHLRRREGVADERRRILRPVDDVDLLAVQLAHDAAHPGAHRADAGALRVDPGHRRPDGDLGAVARLAGDGDDLDRAVDELGHLEREQLAHQAGMRTAQRDLRCRAFPG